jgi:hypothetical protein
MLDQLEILVLALPVWRPRTLLVRTDVCCPLGGNLTTHLQITPMLGMGGVISPVPLRLHSLHRDSFGFDVG